MRGEWRAVVAGLLIMTVACAGPAMKPDAVEPDSQAVLGPEKKTAAAQLKRKTTLPPKKKSAAKKKQPQPSDEHHLEIDTKVEGVQALVDRAMVLTFGFNHAEANKLFKQAADKDPNCAACYWGAAYVLGPNINAPMEQSSVDEAFSLARKAYQLRHKARTRNRALIEALVHRYGPDPIPDRTHLDEAYAQAMRGVARKFPDDALVQALLAEALMDLHPWQYWQEDGSPQPYTPEILAALDDALSLNPDHLLANHLHIHAVEASPNPERAEKSADRLRRLAPSAGHLLHMPAHIYMRLGRYADAAEVNRTAIGHDEAYQADANPEGLYPLAYMPHNRHFLVIALAESGQGRNAVKQAFELAQSIDTAKMREPGYGTLQHFWIMPLYIMVRFGQWDEILTQPSPDAALKYPKGVWHYSRGRALAALGRLVEAEQELRQLERLAKHPFLLDVTIWDVNTTAHLLQIATQVLAGELAYQHGDMDAAIQHLEEAVEREDALTYEEPPSWYYPARQSLGWVLLEAGRFEEAEWVYREDLDRHRENGWSLKGLQQSLEGQGRIADVRQVKKRFDKAWRNADVPIARSRI
ncbi:Tetratricopeptide repeat protein [Nitrospina gracilis 3/211]|uniref:Tetratricopeptide repeat protein n=1 Tax=Nitrospina gracilis (strain 3/211) TaxID=1266370 RepID=M1ZC04_NITG3|nr:MULTISPECIES: hypothetical protein [Nitrospina]MCF8723699.1 tetratricopeptide (TPR) repeat protein [Nitrospina sp. Nb-3]CCQ90787.1 Tetratricopeptide repeat protein [Nitrospina gracilis 3/211]